MASIPGERRIRDPRTGSEASAVRYARAAGIGCLSVGVAQLLGLVPPDSVRPDPVRLLGLLCGMAVLAVVGLAVMEALDAGLRRAHRDQPGPGAPSASAGPESARLSAEAADAAGAVGLDPGPLS